jgi:hypothetical protein
MTHRPNGRLRLPGHRLREVARKFCSPATLEHVVDPIVADMQHEWIDACGRSPLERGYARLRGYAAFTRALTLHVAMSASRHLARNAFGATAEEWTFYRRAGFATAVALLLSTVIVLLTDKGLGARSLVFALTHQRWPGGPAAAEVLPRAVAIVFRPDALASLLPSVVTSMLPPSLLLGLLLASRASSSGAGAWIAPRARWIAGAALIATMIGVVVGCWVVPRANQNYREIVFAAVTGTERRAHFPAKGSHELTFGELGDVIQGEQARGGVNLALYRTERHKRMAFPATCAVFGLLAIGLAEPVRRRGALAVVLTAAAVCLFHSLLLRAGEQVLMPRGAPPFLCAWAANLVFGSGAAILILRRRARMRTGPEAASLAR